MAGDAGSQIVFSKWGLSQAQRLVVFVGIVALILSFLFPPFHSVVDYSGNNQDAYVGHAWLLSPPESHDYYAAVQIDLPILYSEWVLILLITGGLLLFFHKPFSDYAKIENSELLSGKDARLLFPPRTQLKLLVGDSEKLMVDLVVDLVQQVCGKTCKFEVVSTKYGGEILQLAVREQVDLVVLSLNNIFDFDQDAERKRISSTLQLVSDLNNLVKIPTIVYSGLSGFEHQVRGAGAGFYFDVPFSCEEFRHAIVASLNKSARSSVVKYLGFWFNFIASKDVKHFLTAWALILVVLLSASIIIGQNYGRHSLAICLFGISVLLYNIGHWTLIRQVWVHESPTRASLLCVLPPAALIYGYFKYSDYGKSVNIATLGIIVMLAAGIIRPD